MRAHRIYNGRAAGDRPERPRTLIFNLLHYTTRQAILRAAKKEPVTIDGRRVRFTADYSNHTVKRRQVFSWAMDIVRERGIEFFPLYPVTLKIKVGLVLKVFTDHKEAEDFLNSDQSALCNGAMSKRSQVSSHMPNLPSRSDSLSGYIALYPSSY